MNSFNTFPCSHLSFDLNLIDWKKVNNLIPAIIQDDKTHAVLMLGYMNQEALHQTLNNQKVTFYSRTKQRLWEKGETTGHFLKLIDIFLDCDQDTLLIKAEPQGPTCHLGDATCFKTKDSISATDYAFIDDLQALLQSRKQDTTSQSYTSELFKKGIPPIAQKVGEEAVEVVIAALSSNQQDFLEETADLLFHLLMLLTAKSCHLKEVVAILQQRHQKPS